MLNENSEARCRELIELMDSDGDMLIEIRPMSEKEKVVGRKTTRRHLVVSPEERLAVGTKVKEGKKGARRVCRRATAAPESTASAVGSGDAETSLNEAMEIQGIPASS
jgi:hypothetical protein